MATYPELVMEALQSLRQANDYISTAQGYMKIAKSRNVLTGAERNLLDNALEKTYSVPDNIKKVIKSISER